MMVKKHKSTDLVTVEQFDTKLDAKIKWIVEQIKEDRKETEVRLAADRKEAAEKLATDRKEAEARLAADRREAEARLAADRKEAETRLAADRKEAEARLEKERVEARSIRRWFLATFFGVLFGFLSLFIAFIGLVLTLSNNGYLPF